MPPEPSSPYGVSKRTGELYLSYYHQAYGLPYIALRYANVYGPRQSANGEAGVVAIFLSLLLPARHRCHQRRRQADPRLRLRRRRGGRQRRGARESASSAGQHRHRRRDRRGDALQSLARRGRAASCRRSHGPAKARRAAAQLPRCSARRDSPGVAAAGGAARTVWNAPSAYYRGHVGSNETRTTSAIFPSSPTSTTASRRWRIGCSSSPGR